MATLREHDRAAVAHALAVAAHDVEARADERGEIRLVDDEQIALRDARAAFARDFVAAGHGDDVDRVVYELLAELRGEVVSPALEEEQLGALVELQLLERVEVVADVLADGAVRAASG